MSATTSRFHCITATAPDADAAERALAEALVAGASGAEQREDTERVILLLYAPDERAAAVWEAACAVLGAAAVSGPAPVESRDWSEAWKEHLAPIELSPRLRIRPSFERSAPAPGQAELVLDPGRAFGTGAHESTRLALDGLDALCGRLDPATRVLDVGCGSGVLALAALRLGAGRALGFDLDASAVAVARENARANALEERLALFAGPIDALDATARFEVVLANLLRRELLPIVSTLVSHVQGSGWVVISGLIETEVEDCMAVAVAEGLELDRRLSRTDASGIRWAGLLMRRSSGRTRAAASGSRATERGAPTP